MASSDRPENRANRIRRLQRRLTIVAAGLMIILFIHGAAGAAGAVGKTLTPPPGRAVQTAPSGGAQTDAPVYVMIVTIAALAGYAGWTVRREKRRATVIGN